MVECVQKSPRYTAVQWNGTNQQELTELYEIAINYTEPPIWRVSEENGALELDPYGGQMGNMWRPLLGANQWLLVGPYWGQNVPGSPTEILDDEAYQLRFEPAS